MNRLRGRWTLAAVCAVVVVTIAVPASAMGPPSLVKDIAPANAASYPWRFVEFQGKLYFSASDGSRFGGDLWSSDGTEDGTQLVKASSGSQYGFDPSELTPFNGSLFFRATSNLLRDGSELWKSDGTTDGTMLVKDFNPLGSGSPHDFTVSGGKLFFGAYDGSRYGLWTTDGTEAGTNLLTNAGEGWPTDFNGALFFVGIDERDLWPELWRSDGTTGGTLRVTDLPPGSSAPEYLTVIGETLYFVVATDAYGSEIWRTDGTESGTMLLKDINPTGNSHPTYLVNVDGTLYFWAADDGEDTELWKSDGTEEGTVQVKDINPDGPSVPFDYYPQELVEGGGRLFFHAKSAGTGVEVWTSDGTEEGTHIVEDIRPGPESSAPARLTDIGGRLFFVADDGVTGHELWTTDAAGSDAERLTDLNPAGSSLLTASVESGFGVLGNVLYFGADDGVISNELWRLPLDTPDDATPPTISIASPINGSTYELDAEVLADYTCADEGGSELQSCVGDVPDGGAIDTASPGTKVFTVTAIDGAENSTTVSATYEVVESVYDFTGFFSPVDNPPTVNVMQAGRGVRLVFKLGGDLGLDIFAPGHPMRREIPCDSQAPSDIVERTIRSSQSRLTYEAKPGKYVYSWATNKAWQGTCQELVLRFMDGSEHRALFRLT